MLWIGDQVLLGVKCHACAAGMDLAEVACISGREPAAAAVASQMPCVLEVGEQGVGQGKLSLVPHPGTGKSPFRQPDELVGPSLTEPQHRRDHGRGRRLGIVTVRITLIHQIMIGSEQVGNVPLQFRRGRNPHRARNDGGHMIQQAKRDQPAPPSRPGTGAHRFLGPGRLRVWSDRYGTAARLLGRHCRATCRARSGPARPGARVTGPGFPTMLSRLLPIPPIPGDCQAIRRSRLN